MTILFVLAYLNSYQVRDHIWMRYYDWRYGTKLIESEQALEQVLAEFEHIPYRQLPATYKAETQSDQAPYAKMLRSKSYLQVPHEDIYTRIVGNHRIKDFMPKDAYYRAHRLGGEDIIWLVDVRVLKKLLMLETLLAQQGYDPAELTVVNGYRHPVYNKRVGGASKSRHIVGEAIDLSVGDIDRNGRVEKADKDIVLDLLDRKIIGSFGGLGLYPNTQSVHMDVRGYRARWDTY